MKYLLLSSILALTFMSCTDSDEEANLVVDFLDMTSNDYSVQIDYRSSIEIFRNSSYTIVMNKPDSCEGNFVQRRVLPKNGGLQIAENQIIYTPHANFHGIDSIQYEICCNNKCNVFFMKFIIWKDNEERCEELFNNQSSNFYYGYSIGDIATSSLVKVGLSSPVNCEQFVESIIINKTTKFGSVTVNEHQEISYEGDLPKNSSDTVFYTLKLRIGVTAQDKSRTMVIERFD